MGIQELIEVVVARVHRGVLDRLHNCGRHVLRPIYLPQSRSARLHAPHSRSSGLTSRPVVT